MRLQAKDRAFDFRRINRIHEIDMAAAWDRKDLEDHPPQLPGSGRALRAIAGFLFKAKRDI